MQELYDIERKARELELSFDERKKLRQEESVPVLTEFESWMKNQLSEVLPQSAIGKAITYTLKLWKRLVRYADDGSWAIDNNLVYPNFFIIPTLSITYRYRACS